MKGIFSNVASPVPALVQWRKSIARKRVKRWQSKGRRLDEAPTHIKRMSRE